MRGILLWLALLAFVPVASGTWTGFHNDERNTGFASGSSYQAYEDIWWNVKLKSTQIETTPILKDGLVVVTSWDHGIRVFDAESGKAKWNSTLVAGKGAAAKFVGTPVIAGNRIFTVDTTGAVEARDLQKGTLLDTASVGATLASPTIHEGKIFIGNEAGEMQALDTETLTLLWKFSISSVSEATKTTGTAPNTQTSCDTKFSAAGSQIRGAPAVFGGNVIFGSLNHWVFAIKEQGDTAQKTELRWMFKTNDAVFASPTVDSTTGRLFIGSYDEKMYAMPASPAGQGPIETGSPPQPCTGFKNTAAWTFTVPASVGNSKVHSTVAIDGTNAYFGANNGHVYAVKMTDGAKVWEYNTTGPVISSPAVSNGVVVVGSDDANVYWLRTSNGTKIKSFTADSAIKSNPAIDGNRAFVTSFDGSVYMFGPKIPPRPDLKVSSITLDDGLLTILVENAGTADATATNLRLTIDGVLAEDLVVPVVKAGETATLTYDAEDLASGKHSVSAAVDQAASVVESIETNNNKNGQVEVEKSGGKGIGIPAPAPALVMLGLALLVAARRRKA